jgi:hypothetical protein
MPNVYELIISRKQRVSDCFECSEIESFEVFEPITQTRSIVSSDSYARKRADEN